MQGDIKTPTTFYQLSVCIVIKEQFRPTVYIVLCLDDFVLKSAPRASGGRRSSSLACGMKSFIPPAREAGPRGMWKSPYLRERVLVTREVQENKASRKSPESRIYLHVLYIYMIIARVVTKVVAKVPLFVVVLRSLSCSWSFRSLESSSSILLSIGVPFIRSFVRPLVRTP